MFKLVDVLVISVAIDLRFARNDNFISDSTISQSYAASNPPTTGQPDNPLPFLNESRQIIPSHSPKAINTTFCLLRRVKPEGYNETILSPLFFPHNMEIDALQKLPLDPNISTLFIIHGWLNSFHGSKFWWKPIYKIVQRNGSVHSGHYPEPNQVIFVDWSVGASSTYYLPAVSNSKIAAISIALMIRNMIDHLNFDPQKIRLIGFSLGAHVAGFVGKQLQGKAKYKLGWITGLEPANVGFPVSQKENHIFKSDAHFVDIVHTSSGNIMQGFSLIEPLGCLDFYPNGALEQPGCNDLPFGAFGNFFSSKRPCAHDRAPLIFGYDYDGDRGLADCQMLAYNCSTYDDFLEGKCAECGLNNDQCYLMGMTYSAIASAPRVDCSRPNRLYLKASIKPYCLHHYQVVVGIGGASSSQLQGELTGSLCNKSFNFKISGDFSTGNRTALVASSEPLDSCQLLVLKWTAHRGIIGTIIQSAFNPVVVEKVGLNYMSNIDRGIRKSKSLVFCPPSTSQEHREHVESVTIKSGQKASFARCQPTTA